MKIQKNTVVELSYEVEAEGQIVDSMTEERPLGYIHGGNMLLPKFEQQLEGQEPGYEFSFSLAPEEAYGTYDEKNVVVIPKTAFMVDGKIHEEVLILGRYIPMYNGAGEVVQGRIIEIMDNDVRMDFNHPMADKTLNFKGKVISVREATDKELKEGLHGEYLPKEEGGCHHCKGHCHHGDGEGCHHGDGEGCCGGHGDGECGCGGHCHDEN